MQEKKFPSPFSDLYLLCEVSSDKSCLWWNVLLEVDYIFGYGAFSSVSFVVDFQFITIANPISLNSVVRRTPTAT